MKETIYFPSLAQKLTGSLLIITFHNIFCSSNFRQIQDKRYYEGVVQIKFRELSQEIVAIAREIDAHNKERVTLMHYDQQAKDLAAELTDLQGQLAEYNIIVDKMSSDTSKNTMKQVTCDLVRSNDLSLSETEVMFEKRHVKEKQLREIENDITLERRNAERIKDSVVPHSREKYEKLHGQKARLQSRIDEMQHKSDHLSFEKMSLEERVSLSQVKQEAVRLRTKIMEVEEKRDILRKEEKKKLSPEEKKDHFLQKVKQNNISISASQRRIAEIEKRIVEAEQAIEELEVDLDEERSEKLIKFEELRKREKTMEEFIITFEGNKLEELEKLKKLKAVVVDHLESISREMDGEAQLTDSQELVIFNTYFKKNPKNDQDLENLRQGNVRLQGIAMKMENFEKRLKTELQDLEAKIDKYESELVILEDLDGLKMLSKTKHDELLEERDQLKIQKPPCSDELNNMQMEYNYLKDHLYINETYLQMNAFETKLQKLKESNFIMQNLIEENNKRMNYCFAKECTFFLVTKYNVLLKDDF